MLRERHCSGLHVGCHPYPERGTPFAKLDCDRLIPTSEGLMDQRTSNDGDRRVLREEAQEHLEELQQRVGEINDRLVNFIKQRPATALLIAAGAGFLIGRILRS